MVVEMLEEELEDLAERQGMDRSEGARLVARKWAALMLKDGDKWAIDEYLKRRDGAVKTEVGIKFEAAEAIAALYQASMGPEDREVVPELPEGAQGEPLDLDADAAPLPESAPPDDSLPEAEESDQQGHYDDDAG